MATKDVTKQKQATTAADVNGQDAKTRLWQSLNYTYGDQIRKSNEAFAKAYSQASNEGLKRGMQRSSYALQTLANIDQQKIDAENDIRAAQIADYQNRIGQIEQQELENERWEREFEANRADTAWSQNFQQSQFDYTKQRDVIADQQWQRQYDEQLRQFNENMAFQKERAKVSDAQWEKEYAKAREQFEAQMAEQKRQFDLNYNENVRQFNAKMAASAAASSGGGGGGGSRGGNGGGNGGGNTGGDTTDKNFNDQLGLTNNQNSPALTQKQQDFLNQLKQKQKATSATLGKSGSATNSNRVNVVR